MIVVIVVIVVRAGDGDRVLVLLSGFRGAQAVAQLAGPADDALELSGARWCRGSHPGRGVEVFAGTPVLPWEMLGHAVVADDEFVLGVDGVGPAGERELEHLRLGDGLGGAGLDAEIAVDAAQVVDLVDEAVALARRDRRLGVVLGTAHVDAAGGTHTGAELATDALLHAVLVAVQDMTAVHAQRLRRLLLRILRGDSLLASDLAQADEETSEITHYSTTPWRRLAFDVATAKRRSP